MELFVKWMQNGELVENGHSNQAFMMISKVADEATRNKFVGVRNGDAIVFNPVTSIRVEEEVKYLLGIKEGNIQDYSKDYSFTIERINRVEKAEFNQAFLIRYMGRMS
jgi:hypothetical protein